MSDTLTSPGTKTLRGEALAPTIKGEDVGKLYVLGVFEWGEIGKPLLIINPTDRKRKVGGYINGYYGAKSIDLAFAQEGISEVYAVRTAHYIDGVLQASKSSLTIKGYNPEEEDRVKVDTLKFEAKGEGLYGNKINVSNIKTKTVTNAILATGAELIVLDSVDGFEVGDILEISDSSHYIRVIITAINTSTKTVYFKAITLASSIASGASVKTASTHANRTTILSGEVLESNAESLELTSIGNINVGSVVTIIDKRTTAGAPNTVILEVKSISKNRIYFDSIGTISASITAENSVVVTQEFNIKVFLETQAVGKEIEYISMNPKNSKQYIDNIFKSDYVKIENLLSTENHLGDIPECFEKVNLTGGDDGLTGLNANDFIGSELLGNGVYGFNILPRQFAQIIAPDSRWSSAQSAINNYAEEKGLWYEPCFDFAETYEDAVDFRKNEAMFNSEQNAINYPHVKWTNPVTSIVEVIPECAAIAGLNARIWGKNPPGYGPWKQPAGTEDGVIYGIVGLESENEEGIPVTNDVNIRDYLYKNQINSIIKYSPYGYLLWGIRTTSISGDKTQKGEAVTFLYCEHSIQNGMPWTVFKNIDDDFKSRAYSTIHSFLDNIRVRGGLKGKTADEAFVIDLESLNTGETEELGEFYFRIGLATKKAGEFIYFIFSKKIGGNE